MMECSEASYEAESLVFRHRVHYPFMKHLLGARHYIQQSKNGAMKRTPFLSQGRKVITFDLKTH